MKEMKFYGTALSGVEVEPYSGKLIVIEGTDGVGRSTHVGLLRTWLESAGYAVLDTGMTRSILAGRGIKNARAGHTLGRLTMQLYYATDFADRLENQMLPALRAGFIVLTDRYIYSAIARAVVRGADPEWIRAIYGIALVPDAVFYLRIRSAEELAGRVLASGRGFDYWESGMDLGLENDYYDSFIAYQKLLLKNFDRMSGEYGFEVVDASRPVRRVASRLRRSISRLIGDDPMMGPSDAPEVKTEEGAGAASGAANVARESRADGLKKVKAA
jgi:dTMP kinase